MPNSERISVVVAGQVHIAWKKCSVKYNAKSGERTASLDAADEAPDLISNAWAFEPGTPVEIYATAVQDLIADPGAQGTLVFKGNVKDLTIEIDHGDHGLSIEASTKGRDAHDSSVQHKTKEWKAKNAVQIGNDMGLGAAFVAGAAAALPTVTVFRANVGETVFAAVNRLVRAHGYFLHGKRDGKIEVTKHGEKRHAGGIIEGVNLHKGQSKFTDKGRFAKYKVNSQEPKGTGKEKTQVVGEAEDSGARAGRTKEVTQDKNLDKRSAKERAKQMKRTRQGESVKMSCTLVGWRDDAGALWETGHLIYCESTMLHIARDMAIQSVTLTQDQSGTFAELELVDPKALGGKGGSNKKDKSAKAYSKGTDDNPDGGQEWR